MGENIEQEQVDYAKSHEFNSYFNASYNANSYFGLDIFNLYTPTEISNMTKNPMAHNRQLRELSKQLYSANGLYTQCVDYCTSLPTLDFCVVPKGKNVKKKKLNKEIMEQALTVMHHKEIVRDALFKLMVEGIAFYYAEFTKVTSDNRKYLSDYEVDEIYELNSSRLLINTLDVNVSILPLPTDYTRIVGRKNSSFVIAFDLRYFDQFSEPIKARKLKSYPAEIRDAYIKRSNPDNLVKDWLVLDNDKTIVSKIRCKIEEPYGRPLCLGAIKDILYAQYYSDTKRSQLDNINNNIVYQTFPEGDKKGTCSLSQTQQKTQHNVVKDAVMSKNYRNSMSFFSVSAGTKIDQIKPDTSIFDDNKESSLNDNIGLDLGFMANLLSGSGSGNYGGQTNNLQLLLSEIFMWIEPLELEFVKVINKNIINDKNNPVELYYLPCSLITRKEFTNQMKDLYLQGKGSLRAWIASTGFNSEAYLSLMDMELEEDFENKYPVHMTSFTAATPSDTTGRTETDNPTDSTIRNRSNNGNAIPSPSDSK